MRKLFPIFKKKPSLIYLDSAATTQKPQSVIDALTQFYSEEYATVHRAIYFSSLAASEKYNEARQAAAHFLNAKSSNEIVFTRGTTESINLVALSFGQTFLQPGDEILISELEHHSNLVPWQMCAQRTGATLRYMPFDQKGEIDYFSSIHSKTKIVAISHMSNVTGAIHPIKEIAKAVHSVGGILVVDGAQSAPHLSIDVQALDCDFYAFSGHKCYGPTGVGILYGKSDLLQLMSPIFGGGDMIEKVELDKTIYANPPLRFEAGTPMIASVIALKVALEFIQNHREEIAKENDLRIYLESKLIEIPTLRVLNSSSQKGPLTTFSIDSIHPLDLATWLDLKQIAIRTGHLCAQPALRHFGLESAARVSFGVYNTFEEVDFFVDELKKIINFLSNK